MPLVLSFIFIFLFFFIFSLSMLYLMLHYWHFGKLDQRTTEFWRSRSSLGLPDLTVFENKKLNLNPWDANNIKEIVLKKSSNPHTSKSAFSLHYNDVALKGKNPIQRFNIFPYSKTCIKESKIFFS